MSKGDFRLPVIGLLAGLALLVTACASETDAPLAPATPVGVTEPYRIGPGDQLKFFVFGDRSLTDTVTVRPDGRVSIPLVEDLVAANKTTVELGREAERRLRKYVEQPLVTIIVTGFVGALSQQVRVVGEAAEPRAIPYRADMSVLDVMIEAGGLTEFAAGNRTKLVRVVDGSETQYRVRLDDLLRDGDISANVKMQPGDILIIPESFF